MAMLRVWLGHATSKGEHALECILVIHVNTVDMSILERPLADCSLWTSTLHTGVVYVMHV